MFTYLKTRGDDFLCGITGWINFKRVLTNEMDNLQRMTATLTKRGPDDTNYFIDQHVAFGHKRLIVVDPIGGKQPMEKHHHNKLFVICYNGELYNTEDLRKDLLTKGYSFNGHSDTEVLLTSYIEWREKCVEFLNGIFAFAIWDEEKSQVFIGRDRLGVKPLFYSVRGNDVLFGSEIKAILQHKEVQPKLDRNGLSEVLGLGPSRSPGTGVFVGIEELRPAHAMTVSPTGVKVWRYWNVRSKYHRDTLEETVEHVRFLLTDAVKRQLVSDVPLCTFLSGGVDSSAITAIASNTFQEEGKGTLHTYSIDYENNDEYFQSNVFQPNADQPWIELMSQAFQTNHHRCVISQEQLFKELIEAVEVRDLPGMADVDSSLLWFCREIKKDFVVSLSGECADEIFGGYPWFHQVGIGNNHSFPWMRSVNVRQRLLNDKWSQKLKLQDYIQQKFNETIHETPILDDESEVERKRKELFYLNIIWFMTTLLDRKDRMSMGASLEVRVPFADHRLVEYVWNIPWEWKMYGNREKGILRKALEGILPEDVLYRKKSPYPKTHHPKYTQLVQSWLNDILQNSSTVLYELFDKKQLQDLVQSKGSSIQVPWFGQLMTGPQLLAYFGQIHVWFEKYHIQLVES
jgi:asparagine synthase (glutamine-hydrolysing)